MHPRGLSILVTLLALPFCLPAAEIPELVLPQGVGVNIHFVRGHEHELDLIGAAGFKFIRNDFAWGATERKRGEYNWSDYDAQTDELAKRGLRAYYILDYSNPLYEQSVASKNPVTGQQEEHGTASPQHLDSVAAFARWAAAAAKHFQGRHVIWEIWNEPNISFWKPTPDVTQYTTLAVATCKAVREADPQATLVAPASSGFPWPFLERFLRSGVLNYLDAVSVHPYRSPHTPPETAAADYARLRRLIELSRPPGMKRYVPILSGEWGYSSNTKGVSLETQAAFIVRQQLANLMQGVPLSIWYDWRNDGEDPGENEHNFGTVSYDLSPKPAYVSIQTLTSELSGYRLTARLATRNTNDFVLVLTNGDAHTKLAAWSLERPHTVSLALTLAPLRTVTVRKTDGKSEQVQITANSVPLELGPAPQYVDLGSLSQTR